MATPESKTEAKYATPNDVMRIIENLENSARLRSQDRAIINQQFNGGRPYTDAEVEENQIEVNVNKLGGYKIALDANLQVNGALLNKDRFFNARLVKGPKEKREEWGQVFTDNIHIPLKRKRSGLKHLNLMKNRNASLTLHGVGVMVWMNRNNWMPRFVALDDLLVPTDATMDLDDGLGHFGVNAYLTPYQLYKLTHGPKVDPGWDVKFADTILTSIPKAESFTPEIINRPEEMESLWKQHAVFMNSDAVPKIKVTFFFFQDTEDGKWHRRVVFRKSEGVRIADSDIDKFLYKSEQPYADHIDEIIHVQFGDGNVVAPLKFHSVRGLGILLFAVVELDNRMYCQTMQHTFEQLMALLRIQDPSGRDRPKVLQLRPYGVLEEGISFVPPEERNRADEKLVAFSMAQNRQLMSESSSSYVQDIDTGTNKEQTLGEAQIKLQSANKIVGGMLSNMYLQEAFYYEEVVRRFLNQTSDDKDVVAFRNRCIADGIPKELLVAGAWEIDVEKVFGMGDQTLAIQEITAIMGIVNQLEPTAQRIVRRKYIATLTRNPDLARTLVPDDEIVSSKGRQAAEDVFATLMRGIPVSFREGIEQQDYVIAMAEMMAKEIARIQTTDNIGTPQDVIGLQTVAADIEQHMELLSQDRAMKELVTGMGKALGKMMNEVKAFEQRQQEAAQSQQQDPEAIAKIQMEQAKMAAKIENQQAQLEAKLQAQAEKHAQQLRQSEERHQQQIRQQEMRTEVELSDKALKTQADLAEQAIKTQADIAAQKAKEKEPEVVS